MSSPTFISPEMSSPFRIATAPDSILFEELIEQDPEQGQQNEDEQSPQQEVGPSSRRPLTFNSTLAYQHPPPTETRPKRRNETRSSSPHPKRERLNAPSPEDDDKDRSRGSENADEMEEEGQGEKNETEEQGVDDKQEEGGMLNKATINPQIQGEETPGLLSNVDMAIEGQSSRKLKILETAKDFCETNGDEDDQGEIETQANSVLFSDTLGNRDKAEVMETTETTDGGLFVMERDDDNAMIDATGEEEGEESLAGDYASQPFHFAIDSAALTGDTGSMGVFPPVMNGATDSATANEGGIDFSLIQSQVGENQSQDQSHVSTDLTWQRHVEDNVNDVWSGGCERLRSAGGNDLNEGRSSMELRKNEQSRRRSAPRSIQVAVADPSEVDLEEDEQGDATLESSYHSGDSELYEMGHRPILERTAVKRDIQELYKSITSLTDPETGNPRYRIVDRLGEGTFSSVYLAYDCEHELYDNEYWDTKGDTRVAMKKILVTSSPARIENELSILEGLRGCRNVSQLISAFREEDQVVVILPYHRSDDFRYFYKLMDPPKIRQYMLSLLCALKDVHSRGIIHRDVKPANFLFDYETGKGVLVDFGLAERYNPPRKPTCQHTPATIRNLHGVRTTTADTQAVEQALYDARKRAGAGEGRVGFKQEDARASIKTNRAGTRGFRAPEVLFKCPDQTVAIDVWSAGIMLFSILSHKFPVFNSNDDIEALMEIAALFGRGPMERCALLHNRTMICNVPSLEDAPNTLSTLILRLNPHLYTPHKRCPTPEEAKAHIEAVDDAIDLCSKLMRLDCTRRPTAAASLHHKFFANMSEEELRIGAGDGDDVKTIGVRSRDEERIPETEGKCGNLHYVDGSRHQARFANVVSEMGFGQGIPPSRDRLCPDHEHWQQRLGYNPISAANAVPVETEEFDIDQGQGIATGIDARLVIGGTTCYDVELNDEGPAAGRGTAVRAPLNEKMWNIAAR